MTDTWDYTLGDGGGSSSPWYVAANHPVTTSGGKVQLVTGTMLQRNALSGSYVMRVPVDFENIAGTHDRVMAVSPNGAAGQRPGISFNTNTGIAKILGVNYFGSNGTFGTFAGSSLSLTEYSAVITLFMKNTADTYAAIVEYAGAVYKSGFVSLGVHGFEPLIYSDNTAGSGIWYRASSLTITDGLTDEQVQAIYDGAYSLSLGGGAFNIRQWPKPIVNPSILWVQDSAGNWNGSDRGASQDVYETEVVFYDRESAINSLQDLLDDNREGVTLSGFQAPIFSPNVDHTGSISASAVKVGPRRHIGFGVPSSTSQLFELPVTFRAISPTLLGTSPSLSTLKLQEGFTPENSYTAMRAFAYDQTAAYGDHRADIGVFRGAFRQKTAQIQAILAYLLTTARANAISFPSIGATYPFGINRGALPKNCKVKSWSLERANFVFWDLDLELVESV